MYHFFIEAKQIEGTDVRLTGKDVNHIKNVLRMKIEEKVSLTDEDGVGYICSIKEFDKEQILLEILQKEDISHELPAQVTLYQGLPKGDKFETIIQKAVELGVYKVVPVMTKRSIVKLDSKKKDAKVKRWNAIAESAAKQSKRSIIPKVGDVIDFKDAIKEAADYDVVCIPYEQAEGMLATKTFLENIKAGKRIAFYIGPEGGFEEEEINFALEHKITPVSLGKRVLRTETAGMALMAMIMLNLECQMEVQE